MILAIRHFPDRKKPCIVLEEGYQALVLGYLTDRQREKWLRMALMREDEYQLAVQVNSLYTLDEIMESEGSDADTETWNGYHGQVTAPKGTFKRIYADADGGDAE